MIDALVSIKDFKGYDKDFSGITNLLSILLRSYIKEDESHRICPHCITEDKEAMLPPDSAINEKIMNGDFIKRIINKYSLIYDNVSDLLKYMAWENFGLTCAIVAQLFEPSRYYVSHLDMLKELLEMEDSLKYMRLKFIFSQSLQNKDPCGIFNVIHHKNLSGEVDIQLYLKVILDCIKENDKIRDILLRERKADLLLMEDIAFKKIEKTHGTEKARKLFYTNEVNFGVPKRIAAERHGLSPDSELLEIQNDDYCALLMEFKTRLTNYYITNPEGMGKVKVQSPETQKLAGENAHLRELYTFLVLQKDKQNLNANLDDKGGEIVGSCIEKVVKSKAKKQKKEAPGSAATMGPRPNKLTKSDTEVSSSPTSTSLDDSKEESIRTLMEFSGKSRSEVVEALKRHNWNPNDASVDVLTY